MTSTSLDGQTVLVVGGSAGIGLATAQQARAAGADVILAARNPDRLRGAAADVGAVRAEAFDATDPDALRAFLQSIDTLDHIMVTAGAPTYTNIADASPELIRGALSEHLLQTTVVAQNAVGRVRDGGTLVFMGGTGGKRPGLGLGLVGAVTNALPSLIANLALEVAPIRVNLIAAGFVDTPLSASLLGDDLEARREELRSKLPIARVVTADDVAALALHLMTNTALTGATFDIDGGQQLLRG